MKRNVRLLLCWYLSGFILGIIGANLLFRETGYSSGILAVYGTAASKEWIDAEALFSHLLFQRGIYFLSMIFLGLTYIGIFAVVLSLSMVWFFGGKPDDKFFFWSTVVKRTCGRDASVFCRRYFFICRAGFCCSGLLCV